MLRCEKCGIILDRTVRFCPKCGESTANITSEEMPKLEVGAYLTSANLHRIRQEWNEAIADATEALKLDPKNADIASLLGTIYQERGMLDDAVIWYQMALELNPTSASDKARLKQVRKQISDKRQSKKSADPFHLFQSRHKLWAAGLGAVFILVVIYAIIFGLGRGGNKPGRAEDVIVPAHNASSGSAPIRAPGMNSSASSESQSQPVASPHSSSLAGGSKSSSLRTPGEAALTNSISSAQDIGNAKIDDVIADPRQGIAIVSFSMPSNDANRSAIAAAAGAVAKAAFAANSEVKIVTTRCIITPGGSDSTQIVYIADITRTASEALGTAPTADQFLQSFTGQWWNPQISR